MWVGKCNVVNVGLTEYSPGLEMDNFEAFVCMDFTAGKRLEADEDLVECVALGAGDGHGGQDLAWKAHQGNACRLFHETRRRCNGAELRDWIRNKISIRREQADFESLRT